MPETIIDLGKRVKAKYPGTYDHLADADLGRKIKAKYPAEYGHFTDEPAKAEDGGVLDTAIDVAKGVGKGAMSTIFQGGDIIRRATGMERVINRPEVQEITQPSGTAQKVGYGLEQGAEFLLPAGAVTSLSQIGKGVTAGMRGARALNIGTRAALEATGAAGVAGLQSGGDPVAIRNAALTGGALSAGADILAAGAKPLAAALTASARKQYGQVLNPTTRGNKYLAEKVVPGLIERGVTAGTMKGLQAKASAQVERLGQAIGSEFDNLPAGTMVDTKAIVQGLEERAIKELTIPNAQGVPIPMGPQAEQAANNLTGLAKTILSVSEKDASGAVVVPVDKIRSLRQYFDTVAQKAGRYEGRALADQSQAEAHGMAADAIRNELAQQFPDIAKLNKEFAFWKNAEKVVTDTVMRRQGQAKPLGRKIAGAAGAATGFATGGLPGLALGKVSMDAFEALVTSPAWGTISAVTKDRIAKALATGNRGMAEFYIGKAAKAAATSAAATRPAETQSPAVSPVQ